MKIPEKADKWIVFAGTLTLTLDDLPRSKGMDLDAKSIIAVPLSLAVIGAIIYLIWRALCRLSARLLRNRSSGNVRVSANSVSIATFQCELIADSSGTSLALRRTREHCSPNPIG
jgi:hypothetical protein